MAIFITWFQSDIAYDDDDDDDDGLKVDILDRKRKILLKKYPIRLIDYFIW